MAEILSQSEQTNLEALLNIGQYKNYWIGLSDLAYEGKFEWQHSLTPLGEYTKWAAGEPDNDGGDEDCVMIIRDHVNYWNWDDYVCELNQWYDLQIHALCQINKKF